MKRAPCIPAPDIELLASHRKPLFDLEISVITPLFGGGAEPGIADPLAPVRASSIRGHLRFWWRACKGAGFETADDLFTAEEEIWGSVDYPSPIVISIQTLSRGMRVQPSEYKSFRDGRFPAYALFPYQQAVETAIVALEGVRFRLCVTLGDINPSENKRSQASKPSLARDDTKAHVEAALWAWLTFGGIGARTRRGCGSLFCNDSRFVPAGAPNEWLRQKAQEWVISGRRALPIPTLQAARLVLGARSPNAMESWRLSVNQMRGFRQAPIGRPQGKVPGHSRWPEADSLRRLADRPQADMSQNYYPRADLGLPVIFHFKKSNKRVEPADSTLQAEARDGHNATRMASAIILKPLALSEREAVPLVLCLDAPHVWNTADISLTLDGRRLAENQLHDVVKSRRVDPLREHNAETARDAFMNYAAKSLGNRIVTLQGKEGTK